MSDIQNPDPAIIPVVSVSGERGPGGDPGHDGRDGRQGIQGIQGVPGVTTAGLTGSQGIKGERGRSLTIWQAAAMFFLILVIGVGLSFYVSQQQRRIEQQQHEIAANSLKIRQANYQGCLGGIAIIQKFNAQQDALASIEQSLLDDPAVTDVGKRVATKRIAAYQAGKIALSSSPEPCGPEPK